MFAAIFPVASATPAAAGAGASAAGASSSALAFKKAERPSLPTITLSTEIYNELIVYIFYFLSVKDLNQTSLVCRNWHVLSQAPYSWKKRISVNYGPPLLSSSPTTHWRQLHAFHGIKAALDRGIFEDPVTHKIKKQLVTGRQPADAKMHTPPLPAASLATKCLGRTEDASYSFALIESGDILQTDSTKEDVKMIPTLFSQKDPRLAKCVLQAGIPVKAQNGHLAICYLEDPSKFHVEIISYAQIAKDAEPSTHVFRTFSLKHTFVRMRITENLMCLLTNSKVIHWNWKTATSPHEMSPPIEQLAEPRLEDITAFEICKPYNGVTLIEYQRKHLRFMKWDGFISRMCGSIQFEPGESFLAQYGHLIFSTQITKNDNVQKVTIQVREMVLKGIILGDYAVKSKRVIEDVVAKGRFKPEIFDRMVGMCTYKVS